MRNTLTVVMYHYVRHIKKSRYPNLRGLEFNLFKEQVLFLKKHYNPVSAEQVIDGISGGDSLPQKAVLLTFDDGYQDHFNYVFPFLDEQKIFGAFYPPSEIISGDHLLDINKIHFLLASAEDINKLIMRLGELIDTQGDCYGLKSMDYYKSIITESSRFDTSQVVFFKSMLQHILPEEARNSFADIMFEEFTGLSQEAFSKELYLNENQLKAMVRFGVHVGSHGDRHYRMDRIPPEKQEEEVIKSLEFLKNLGVNLEKWSMCYPYGAHNESLHKILSKHSCKFAFTTEVGVARLSQKGRFTLPRLDTNDLPKDSQAFPNDWY